MNLARWMVLALILVMSEPALAAPAAQGCARPKVGAFRVFQALIYSKMPDWGQYGIETAHVVDRGFWRDEKNWRNADPVKSRTVVRALPADSGPIIINIENLDLHRSNPASAATVRELVQIGKWFKAAAGKRAVGHYGLAPLGDYWRAIDYPPGGYVDWQRDNTAAAPINAPLDYVFPSLYTYYRDQAGWVRQARAMVCEARRISGKPVYAFIWPEFHPSTVDAGREIPADYWRLQLQTLHEIADGIVIWGGYDLQHERQRQWDDTAAWWRVTREELANWRRK